MTYTITIPSVTAAGFGANPCAAGQAILLFVSVTEIAKILTPRLSAPARSSPENYE